MKHRRIGDFEVSAIGLGGMPMSIEGRKDHDTSIATIHAALDAGITFIDTADAYNSQGDETGHNERLIAEALASYGSDTSHVLVATKGGLVHKAPGPWERDGHPDYLKKAAKASAHRLGVERIGLYQFHRPDPAVDYADSLGAFRELFDEGVIHRIGISNANVDEIKLAHSMLGRSLVSVQNQFSPAYRSSAVELELCIELDLAFLPWSPLGGITKAAALGDKFTVFNDVAKQYGVSPQQIALAWELHLSHLVIPIPGASRPESIIDSAKAVQIELAPETVGLLSTGG